MIPRNVHAIITKRDIASAIAIHGSIKMQIIQTRQ